MAAMMAARMVARLAGPLPVRLVEVSSLNVVSRTYVVMCLDRPVLADQAGQVLRGGVRAGETGDGVDGLAGGPAGGGVLPPAGDLDGLAGVREVQAADVGGLQGPGLRRLRPCPVSRVELPAGTCRQGRALTRACSSGWFCFTTAMYWAFRDRPGTAQVAGGYRGG
jgi:hypothetical protein